MIEVSLYMWKCLLVVWFLIKAARSVLLSYLRFRGSSRCLYWCPLLSPPSPFQHTLPSLSLFGVFVGVSWKFLKFYWRTTSIWALLLRTLAQHIGGSTGSRSKLYLPLLPSPTPPKRTEPAVKSNLNRQFVLCLISLMPSICIVILSSMIISSRGFPFLIGVRAIPPPSFPLSPQYPSSKMHSLEIFS